MVHGVFLMLQRLVCANGWANENRPKITYVTKQANVSIVRRCGLSAPSAGFQRQEFHCGSTVEQLENGQFAWGSVVPKEALTAELVLVGHGLVKDPGFPKENYGCEKDNFSLGNFTGRAALIYNGPLCTFETKVKLAAEAGAEIVVIVNDNGFYNAIETMFIGQAEKYKVISLMINNRDGRKVFRALKNGENLFLKLAALGGSESNDTTTLAAEKIIFFLICFIFFQ